MFCTRFSSAQNEKKQIETLRGHLVEGKRLATEYQMEIEKLKLNLRELEKSPKREEKVSEVSEFSLSF